MSNIERKAQVKAVGNRINSLVSRLQEKSGKPLETRKPISRLVYLLLDTSVSMSGEKLSQAKIGAVTFAKDAFLKSYGAGLITFDETAQLRVEACPGIEKKRQLSRY